MQASDELRSRFIRPCPKTYTYQRRLKKELYLVEKMGFLKVFLQVMDILEMSKDVPHIVRGSSGSSLLCFLLGITQVDPVKEGISLARFMNNCREDFPDIDIDFPYNQRNVVLERINAKYGDRVARISNHIHYKETSAIREAIRRRGYRKFLPRNFDLNYLFPQNGQKILKEAQELVGSFKNYSLHCGGIVIFDRPIPEKLLLKKHQIKYDKRDIKAEGLVKIDLLCNRGLAQLTGISKRSLESYPEDDPETASMFCRGDVLGITFAESPAMKRVVQAIQPRSRRDIAICLALVRPAAASRGRKLTFLQKWQQKRKKTQIVFDDDAIWLIQKLTGINEDKADYYRRAFSKNDKVIMAEFGELIRDNPNRHKFMEDLGMMRQYSFCKSHAISYSYLVWALAYWKARDAKSFWHAALLHCHSMYAPWVHIMEAKRAGLKILTPGPDWRRDGDVLYSPKRTPELFPDGHADYRKHGYWLSGRFMPGCTSIRLGKLISIRGLIATYRRYKSKDVNITFATVGTASGQYFDLVMQGSHKLRNMDILEIIGEEKKFFNSTHVEVTKIKSITSLKRQWRPVPAEGNLSVMGTVAKQKAG